MLAEKEFNARAHEITQRLFWAKGWKWNMMGAAYSTRLIQLKEYLQETIILIDKLLKDDGV